jgi:two-component system sensor histidine kinase UhpB
MSRHGTNLATFTEAFNAMLDRLTDERRAGARAALSAQEDERLRIARALHDEAGQTLTAVALELERAAGAASEADRPRLEELAAQLHSTLEEIRRIARELRPEALDDLGLINALIALSSRISRQGGVSVERRLSQDLPPLSPELELVLYRVAQEALTNVIRHAGASRCVIELCRADGTVELSVSDDGRGMAPAFDGEAPGIGIEGMRERALLAGGTLAIESRPGSGTTVRLTVPAEGR